MSLLPITINIYIHLSYLHFFSFIFPKKTLSTFVPFRKIKSKLPSTLQN